MSKIESYTMHDMHQALQQVASPDRELSPQPIYNARGLAAKRGREEWREQERLSQPQPTQFDQRQTQPVFRVMRHMTMYPMHKDGRILFDNNIDAGVLWKAEKVLFTEKTKQSSEAQRPSEPLAKHEPGEDKRPPYVIRGHHLHYFADVEEMTPEIKAERVLRGLIQGQQQIAANPEGYSEYGPLYFGDTIGKTEQTQDVYKKKLETNFDEYADLPDNYPVELRPAAKDAICNSCDIGDHCAVRKFPLRDTGTVEYDTNHISVFVHEAVRLGHVADVKLISGTAKFTNAEDEEVEGIRTAARTFKAILAESPVNWPDIAEPISFKK